MPHLKLFHYPLACSFVTLVALEETGLDYNDQAIDILNSEQNSPEYLKINPHGKVPALMVGEETVLVENAAILIYLNNIANDKLLPGKVDSLVRAQALSDLVWCSSTLHPAVRQITMPIRFTSQDPQGIKQNGLSKSEAFFSFINDHLAKNQWWCGENWSIIDTYINWCVMLANIDENVSLTAFPNILHHHEKQISRMAYQRAQERAHAAKEKAGIIYPFEHVNK